MSDILNKDQRLNVNQTLRSENNRYELKMQDDNNLVFRDTSTDYVVWDSNTLGTGANTVVLDPDGDLKLYCFNAHNIGTEVWSTNTRGLGVEKVKLTNEGQLVFQGRGDSVIINLTLIDNYLREVMALASEYAYYPLHKKTVPDIEDWQHVASFADSHENEPFAIVFVQERTESVIVSFRGTDSLKDKFTDLDVRGTHFIPYDQKEYENTKKHYGLLEGVKVHSGFYNIYSGVSAATGMSLREHVQLFLRQRSFKKIFLTGHSLGGALAHLCTYDMLMQVPHITAKKLSLVTFGSPAVGGETMRTNIIKMKQPLEETGSIAFHRIYSNGDTIAPEVSKFGYVYWDLAELDWPIHGHDMALYRKNGQVRNQSAEVKYELANVKFHNGGSATGNFSYNSTNKTFSKICITIKGPLFEDGDYTFSNSDTVHGNDYYLDICEGKCPGGSKYFRLSFERSLSASDAEVTIAPASSATVTHTDGRGQSYYGHGAHSTGLDSGEALRS